MLVPVVNVKSYGDRSFQLPDQSSLNELPCSIRNMSSTDIFKTETFANSSLKIGVLVVCFILFSAFVFCSLFYILIHT